MEVGIYFGQEPINIFPNQVLTRVPEHFVDVVGDTYNLTPPMEDIVNHINTGINHN